LALALCSETVSFNFFSSSFYYIVLLLYF